MTNVIVLQEHTPGTPLYTPSQWYTPGRFWYTLGCTIHPVDKHCSRLQVSTRVPEGIGSDGFTHGPNRPWARARGTLSYDDSILTKNLTNCAEA